MKNIVLNIDSVIDNTKIFVFRRPNRISSFLRIADLFSFFFVSMNKLYLIKDILFVNIYNICQADLVQFFFSFFLNLHSIDK